MCEPLPRPVWQEWGVRNEEQTGVLSMKPTICLPACNETINRRKNAQFCLFLVRRRKYCCFFLYCARKWHRRERWQSQAAKNKQRAETLEKRDAWKLSGALIRVSDEQGQALITDLCQAWQPVRLTPFNLGLISPHWDTHSWSISNQGSRLRALASESVYEASNHFCKSLFYLLSYNLTFTRPELSSCWR